MNLPLDVINQTLRILILEDQIADAELCQEELRRAGLHFTVRRVETRAEFEAALDEFRPDLIISDFTLPGAFDGLMALELARTRLPEVPFVFVSGTIGEERAVEAMKRGAADYVLKDRMARLGSAVPRVMEGVRLRREKEQAEAALKASETLYRGIFEGTAEGILLSTLNGYLLAANPAAAKMLGYGSPEELESSMTNPGYRLYAEPDSRRMFIERVKGEGEVHGYETRGLRKDGTPLWVSLSARLVRDQQGGTTHILTMISDITERKRAEAALRESEQRFRAIFDQAGIGITIRPAHDRKQPWMQVNDHFCKLLGYTRDELLTLSTADITPADEQASAVNDNERLLGSDISSYAREKQIIHKDGRRIWVLLSVAALPGPDGRPANMIATYQDIGERKEAEEKVRRLNRVYAVLSGINTLIVHVTDRQELFDGACRIAVEHGGFGMVWIGLLNPKEQEVRGAAQHGFPGDFGEIKVSLRTDHTRQWNPAVRVISGSEPFFDNSIISQPELNPMRQAAVALGYRSLAILPLAIETAVVGTMFLYAKEPGFFNSDEIRLMTELAGNISFALDHIASREKVEKLTRIRSVTAGINAAIVRARNRQMLFYEACRIAVEHGGFGMAWIGEFNAETLEVKPVASAGLEDSHFLMHTVLSIRADGPQGAGVLPTAVRENRVIFNNDITVNADIGGERRKEAIRRGYRSVIVLPLIVDGVVKATFSMFAKELNYFDDEEVGRLTELAGNLSFALDHMARQEKIGKLSRIRAVSGEINAAIVRVRDRKSLFEEMCRIAIEHGKFRMAWAGQLDRASMSVKPDAWAGIDDEYARGLRITMDVDDTKSRGTTPRAVREQRAVWDNDFAANPGYGHIRSYAIERGVRSAITLPLQIEGEIEGVVAIYSEDAGFFNVDEIRALEEMASNVSLALDSMVRRQKVEKLSRIRRVLGEINAAIVRIHDKQQLLEEACRIAAEAGRFPFVWIGNYERDAKQVRPVAQAGDAAYLETVRAPRPVGDANSPGEGLVATAVLGKAAVIVNDVRSDPRVMRRKMHLDQGTHSISVLPLLVSGEVACVLALHARETGFFDSEEMALLAELSSDIAFALQTIERQEKLDYLSYYDPITALPNRSLFVDRLNQQLHGRDGEQLMVAVIMLNIERFRYINETLGRHGGDELLKLVAQRLERAFHGKDCLARISADGFGVVIRGVRDTAAVAHALQDQVLGCFHESIRVGDSDLRVAAKAGVAVFPADGGDADTLFKNAEAALKRARESGERYLFYAAEMNARAAQVLSLETRLRRAVEAQEFVLHYQPKITLRDDKICGLEALIRWQDPASGLVAPGTFIPLLEETGLILEVGKWALQRALSQHREWTARGCAVPRIAVNVSAIQLQQKDFSDIVINVVQEHEDNPDALELEVTESLLMKDIQASIRKLSILRGLGVTIAMDDFGTGYSSLAYLARLPINSIKIDRSFVNAMLGSPQDMGIVTTIIALAHSMKLKVVAEGVETGEQSQLLKLLQCDEAQGFLFSKPLPAAEIEALLRA